LPRGKTARILSAALYFAFAYGVLYSYADNYFCSASRGQGRTIVSAKLALACTAWDICAGACGALAVVLLGKRSRWLGVFVSTLVTGLGLASIPSWIYRGYGHFLFENTRADVSCFFTEGYGMMFPFIVAPVLALATLIREWMATKNQRVSVETS
jgi:hypothetical protein